MLPAALIAADSPLAEAVSTDDLATVEQLIKSGADVKAQDRYGFTPLYFACNNGNAAIIRKLVEAGADPNAASAEGETALITAVRNGDIDSIKVLLQHGAAVNANDTVSGQTALMWAARTGHMKAADLLIEYGAQVNAATRTGKAPPVRPPNYGGGSHGLGINRGGWPERGFQPETPGGMTALLYAARDGRLEVAKLLLAAKADINQAEANGISPLLMALTNNHLDIAGYFLEHGASAKAADQWGRTPLFAAVEIRDRDIARSGEHDIDRPAALELMKTILDRGADPNARTKEVFPIRRFISPFGDLAWSDFTGQTAFLRAALAGDLTVMHLLLDHGADPNIPTLGGNTALMAAAGVSWMQEHTFTESKESLLEAVKLCYQLGGDVNHVNAMGVTAAMAAANRGSDDILQFLVDHGARLDVKDNQGRTVMDWAKGVFLLLNPPIEKPATEALIAKLSQARAQ